jgi:Uma2 family endonuclease
VLLLDKRNQDVATVAEHCSTVLQKVAFPPEPVCRLGVEQYEGMIRSGIIMEDDPVELLDGWLVPKITKSPSHVLVSELVRDVLHGNVPKGWCVYSQNPLRLSASMPEPDVMVVRGDLRQYRDRLPRAEDIGLIVEVSDTSVVRDQSLKKAIYAQAGIPIYWLVNLLEQRVEVYAEPSESGETSDYRQRTDFSLDGQIPLVLDGTSIASLAVREFMP